MGPYRFRFRREQSRWIARQLREYRQVPRDEATWRLLHDAYVSAFPDDEPCSLATYQSHFRHLEQKEAMESAQGSVDHMVQSNRSERYGAQAAARAALVAATTASSTRPLSSSSSCFLTPTRGKRARPIDLSMDDDVIKDEPTRHASMTPVKLKKTTSRAPAESFSRACGPPVSRSGHSGRLFAVPARRPMGKQPPVGKSLDRRPVGYKPTSSHGVVDRAHAARETWERQTMHIEDLRSTLVHRDTKVVQAETAARQWRQEYDHIRAEAAHLRAHLKQQQVQVSDLETRVLRLEAAGSAARMTSHAVELPLAQGHGAISFTLNIQEKEYPSQGTLGLTWYRPAKIRRADPIRSSVIDGMSTGSSSPLPSLSAYSCSPGATALPRALPLRRRRHRFEPEQSAWIQSQLHALPPGNKPWRRLYEAFRTAFPEDRSTTLEHYRNHVEYQERKQRLVARDSQKLRRQRGLDGDDDDEGEAGEDEDEGDEDEDDEDDEGEADDETGGDGEIKSRRRRSLVESLRGPEYRHWKRPRAAEHDDTTVDEFEVRIKRNQVTSCAA
ncbi:hypothetical protein ATCC90586_000296 [Pythium insidiosum]|nr:hypothetical protein ATCC90586_000296 [Pythium insidiosum]